LVVAGFVSSVVWAETLATATAVDRAQLIAKPKAVSLIFFVS
jgi:hypothetical protein